MTPSDQSESVRYRTIVADPPWDQGRTSNYNGTGYPAGPNYEPDAPMPLGRGTLPYPTMSVEEIAALPVSDLALSDAHLYLWTTQRFLRSSFEIAETWGFAPNSTLVWCKKPSGVRLGGAFPATVEFVLFCRRGSLPMIGTADKAWWEWPRRRGAPVARGQRRTQFHSAKPEAFLDIVEQVSPGPYVELFARRDRLGWDTWGNESLGTTRLAFDEKRA
jgi:N6-adenosine-specific RNA methylase IME4